jgi:hypothetical protein
VVAILSTIAGAQFNILCNLNGFPRIPINEGTLTAGGIITAMVTSGTLSIARRSSSAIAAVHCGHRVSSPVSSTRTVTWSHHAVRRCVNEGCDQRVNWSCLSHFDKSRGLGRAMPPRYLGLHSVEHLQLL